MGVGMGATDPRFHEDNPARIASGVGGVVFMLTGLFYLAVVVLLLVRPLDALRAVLEQGFEPSASRWVAYGLYVGAAIGVSLVAHHLPLWMGARALRHRED